MTAIEPPAVPLPPHNEPENLPVERAENPNVQVATENGVRVYFNPATREFHANLGPTDRSGSESRVHSGDFGTILSRIRARCLVVPVDGYLISTSTLSSSEPVEVRPCTVLEHHPRRTNPFVVSAVVTQTIRTRGSQLPEIKRSRRIYATDDVYLPTPEQIERLKAAVLAVREEEARHRRDQDRLKSRVDQAMAEITTLDASILQSVQKTKQQVARDARELDALVFDVVEEDEEAENDE